MYKIKRFSKYSTKERVKAAIGAAAYTGVATAIPGTILGYILGGTAGLLTRHKGWASKGAAVGGALTGLLGAAGGANMSWYMTSPKYQEENKKREEEVMKEKSKAKYPKESSSTIIKAIKEAEKEMGFKFPDQLYKLAKVQADFNNEYFPQWDKIEAFPLNYPDWIPQIAIQWIDVKEEYEFSDGGITILSGVDDGGDWLVWWPEDNTYTFENRHGGTSNPLKMQCYLT